MFKKLHIDNKDFNVLLKIFNEFWSIKYENYHLDVIKSLVFSYKIIDKKSVLKPKLTSHKSLNKK